MLRPLSFIVLLAVLIALVSPACGSAEPWLTVRLSETRITPNGDGEGDSVVVHYRLTRPATVDLFVASPEGERFALREGERRPGGEDYQFTFDGTYAPEPGGQERRVLPDGRYLMTVAAIDAGGQRVEASAEFVVEDADTDPPRLENVVANPTTISPNFDAEDDASLITFRLTKPSKLSMYVVNEEGQKVEVRMLDAPHDASEYTVQWNAVVNDAPLPDGEYQFVIAATDYAGNTTVASIPITLASGGRPDARVLYASFSPQEIMLGSTIKVEIRVRNVGDTVLRTQGPDPGYVYDSFDNFGSIEDGKYIEQPGYWRVGADWSGAPSSAGARYPYRWGFGHDLQPGEEVLVVGYIRILQPAWMWFHAGLIQEGIRYFVDGVGRTLIKVN